MEEADGWRYQLIATNTPTGHAQFLEARHRPHARVEDRIRTGKSTGIGHLPSKSYALNQAWARARYGDKDSFNFEAPLTSLVWVTSVISMGMTYLLSWLLIPGLGDGTMWWKLATIISCGRSR